MVDSQLQRIDGQDENGVKSAQKEYNYMDQFWQQRTNQLYKSPLKSHRKCQPLPFVDFLSTKENHTFSNNSLKWPTPRKLLSSKAKKHHQRPLQKLDSRAAQLNMIKGTAVPSGSQCQQKSPKQHSLRKLNSSKPTQSSYSAQSSRRGEDSHSASMKKIARLLKTCIYLSHDIITTSAHSQQIQYTAIDHSLAISLHPACDLPLKTPHPSRSVVYSKGCPLLTRQTKQRRIQADLPPQGCTLYMNS